MNEDRAFLRQTGGGRGQQSSFFSGNWRRTSARRWPRVYQALENARGLLSGSSKLGARAGHFALQSRYFFVRLTGSSTWFCSPSTTRISVRFPMKQVPEGNRLRTHLKTFTVWPNVGPRTKQARHNPERPSRSQASAEGTDRGRDHQKRSTIGRPGLSYAIGVTVHVAPAGQRLHLLRKVPSSWTSFEHSSEAMRAQRRWWPP